MLNNNIYTHPGDTPIEVWMGLNEVNIVAASDDVVIYEYALWQNGVRRWCKNAATADGAELMRHIADTVCAARDAADNECHGE